ncbi:MAG TPA: Stk1 family PASTA domain-containing Ser/Thr kinase [Ruminococcaceae bacterium]|nr:Stk1 family PASTA domain-containing Ser/Thr kinase [Oscillospiraceae bacterium]
MDKYVGKRLDGRYEIREIIGVGGMAVVYKAYDSIDGRTVAVKILKEEFLKNDEFRRRFKNESKAIAVLSHPNIVKVYDVSFGDLIQYIVMEYIEGTTLKQYIESRGIIPWPEAVLITRQILGALNHAHQKGIVHRDIKPQNIMMLPDKTVKVTDFGIARFSRDEQRTITDKAIGSVHYISPEQARGDATDAKADLYSVGVLLYEMLTGCLPFEADSAVSVAIMQLQSEPKKPREINPVIPVGLEQITMHAMEKTVNRRYDSAAAMLADLDKIQQNPDITFNYTYFVDRSPTKFVSAPVRRPISTVSASKKIDELYDEDDYEEDKKKTKVIPILAAVAAAFVVIGIIIFFVFFANNQDDVAEIPCPNFVGMDYTEVTTSSEYANLDIKVIARENNAEYAYNQIFYQSIDPDRMIKENQTIEVKVSKGMKTVTVPSDLVGLEAADAVRLLEEAGFETEEIDENSDDIEEGLVTRTEPASGEEVQEGSKVAVYVSQGPAEKFENVPNVVGRSLNDARSMIEEKGFVVGSETPKDSDEPEGTVLEQNPAGGQALLGEAINLVYSNGAGVEKTVTVQVDLAQSGSQRPASFQVMVSRAGSSDNYDGQRNFSGVVYPLKVTSKNATEQFDIFLDGEFYMTIEVDMENGTYDTIEGPEKPFDPPSEPALPGSNQGQNNNTQ